jgi:hypothetical protein
MVRLPVSRSLPPVSGHVRSSPGWVARHTHVTRNPEKKIPPTQAAWMELRIWLSSAAHPLRSGSYLRWEIFFIFLFFLQRLLGPLAECRHIPCVEYSYISEIRYLLSSYLLPTTLISIS